MPAGVDGLRSACAMAWEPLPLALAWWHLHACKLPCCLLREA